MQHYWGYFGSRRTITLVPCTLHTSRRWSIAFGKQLAIYTGMPENKLNMTISPCARVDSKVQTAWLSVWWYLDSKNEMRCPAQCCLKRPPNHNEQLRLEREAFYDYRGTYAGWSTQVIQLLVHEARSSSQCFCWVSKRLQADGEVWLIAHEPLIEITPEGRPCNWLICFTRSIFATEDRITIEVLKLWLVESI